MKIFRALIFLCCSLAVVAGCHFGLTQPVRAEAAAEAEEKAPKPKEPKAEEPPAKEEPEDPDVQAPAPKRRVFKRARLYGLPALKPKQLTKSTPLIEREPAAKKKPAAQKSAAQPLPANRRPNPPFWSPRQSGLSAAATYQLNSLGRHVHLSPAMRWHLNRSHGGGVIAPPGQPLSTATTLPGQGAAKFYPGVSRLQPRKPFADVQRLPSGFQSYWPLLLEGREDPNTGLILWSLP